MTNNFDDIIENVETSYILVSSQELTLTILPYFDLPAEEAAKTFVYRNSPNKLLKHLYKLIKLAMKNPEEFDSKVKNTGISYAGLIQFLNKWTKVSNLYQIYDNNHVILDEELGVKYKTLIAYLIYNINKITEEYNAITSEENKIDNIFIHIDTEEETE